MLSRGGQIVFKKMDNPAVRTPDLDGQLEYEGIQSLCVTPVANQKQLAGTLGLVNIGKHQEALSLLKMIAVGLASAILRSAEREEWNCLLNTDPLTGHLNYEGYKIEVERLLRENPGRKYSLWYCDIKKFKFINDVYGYDVGDRLLKYWMEFVAKKNRKGETFCRISADNLSFLRYYEDVSELHATFDKEARLLSKFEELAAKRFQVEVVSGVYLVEPDNRLSVEEMLNRANMAQKRVKPLPGNQFTLYTDAMRQKEIQEFHLTADMRDVLKNEEFVLYLQPQMPLQGPKSPIRAEVLVRWRHQDQTITMPGEFIGLFEQNGLIVDLDYYMFEHACRFLAKAEGCQGRLCLSVNVSRITMLQPHFVEGYCAIKEKYGLPDGGIELEFTENGVVEDVASFVRLVAALRQRGFLCSMDDFGTGQSSLNILQALPLDILKLDHRFFQQGYDGERNRAVVSNVIRMARELKMRTVAEGIEEEKQVDFLRELGCDYIQGYYYSRPIPARTFEERYIRAVGEPTKK